MRIGRIMRGRNFLVGQAPALMTYVPTVGALIINYEWGSNTTLRRSNRVVDYPQSKVWENVWLCYG